MSILVPLGVGSAKVNLTIPEDVEQGETIEGTLEITGGDAPQDIEAVHAALRSEFDNLDDGEPIPYTVAEYTLIDGPFTIQPDDNRKLDVTLEIPKNAPVTTLESVRRPVQAWVSTSMDVDWAVDPSDKDALSIAPAGMFAVVHEGMRELGFTVRDSEVEAVARGMDYDGHPLMITYREEEDAFEVNEVRIHVGKEHEDSIQIVVDVDLEGINIPDDIRTAHIVETDDVSTVASEIRQIIEESHDETAFSL